MKIKLDTLSVFKSIRKQNPPPSRIERPVKGIGGYRRPQGNYHKWDDR